MAVYFDEDSFDSEMLDTKNTGVLCENFTYVVDNLIQFVDPKLNYGNVKLPDIKGGQRRMVRAMRGKDLGYAYKTAASTSVISSKGTKTITAFGTDILVEEWTVSHGDVSDPDLGEEYPASDSQGPRGPYTCLITARITIKEHKPTRCYLQCNCQDFKATFYEKLNQQGYTNPQSLPASTGKKALAPAMCKHLYAIYSKYYTNLIGSTENYVIDSNPVLNGGPQIQPIPTATQPIPTKAPIITATNRDEAIQLIQTRLNQEIKKLKNNPDAYFDSRGKAAGGGRHHLYMFSIVLLNGQLRAIAYRNKDVADPKYKTSGPIQQLVIPDNPKIWKFLNKASDHALLNNMIKAAGPMSDKMNNEIKAKTGMAVYLEGNILSSILESL